MKTKTKILAFVALASLTMVLLMVGVWALKTINFTVGGNLSYIAPGIEATISKGTMSNGVWVNAGDASTKMPLTQITRLDTEETLTTKFSYWQDLNLNFNETGDDVTITFSITNDMEEKYLSINVTTSYASADNATISINTSSVTLDPDASQSFTITMKVTDKTANATLSSFAIVFHMEMVESPPAKDVGEYPMLSFKVTDSTNKYVSVEVGSTTPTGDMTIPQSVLISGVEYIVTSITEGEIGVMGEGGFGGYTGITSIKIPNTVTKIGDAAFWGCSGLKSIVIPDSVTYLGGSAFRYCTSLTSVIIGKGVTSIESSVFYRCWGLTSVIIENGVTSIGNNAFSNCTSLATVEVKATTVPTGASNMFYNCPLTIGILVPSGSEDDYKSATYWSTYSTYIKAGSF